MRVRSGKLEIRKKLRCKSAEEMDYSFESCCKRKGRGWRLERKEKKELTERRTGRRRVLIVRMSTLAPVETTGVQKTQKKRRLEP
jgi:hypothetical protein